MIAAPVVPHLVGLPTIPGIGCPGGSLDPACDLGGAAASSIAGSVLGSVTGWVVSGATWVLGQIGAVLSATTSIDVGAAWFRAHFSLMVGVAGVVVLPLLLISVIEAVFRQSAARLLRVVFVNLPLAVLLTFAALQLVQMGVKITDELSDLVASGSGTDLQHVLSGVGTALTAASASSGPPAFVLLLVGLVVALGALALWIELLVRAAAVYVTVLFVPLALASLVWPAISHTCRRLVETLVALILSKFVIVSILCLALGALGSGSGFSTVLAGAALLLLAAFAPVALLRLVPVAQFGAVEHLDSVRHRAAQTARAAPRAALTASSLAAQLGAGSLDGALSRAGPVGSMAMTGSGDPPSAGSGGSGGSGASGRSAGSGASGAPVGAAAGGGIGPWPGDATAGSRLAAALDGVGATAGGTAGAGAGAAASWVGRPPVTVAPDRSAVREQGQAFIDQDELGPTIRFVATGESGGHAGEDERPGLPDRRPASRPG